MKPLAIEESPPQAAPPWLTGMGLAVAGAALGRYAYLQRADGEPLHSGLNVIVGSDTPELILDALATVLAPLKRQQLQGHLTLAKLDRARHQRLLEAVASERAGFEAADIMPDPEHLAFFDQQNAELQHLLLPMKLLENPAPGRLTLALGKSADSKLLAVYDDRGFGALLDAGRTQRGSLDLELLGKSFRQEIFDGAYLEGLHETATVSPQVVTIVVARPDTIARLLMSPGPLITGFADGCLVFCDSVLESGLAASWPARDVALWNEAIRRILAEPKEGTRITQMSTGAAGLINDWGKGHLGSHPDDLGFLSRVPRLAAKVAFLFHVTESEVPGWVTEADLAKALAIIEMNLNHRTAVRQNWGRALADQEFQRLCELILRKITALGPLSGRELARTFDDQRMDRLLPCLHHLVETEQITKRPDRRFDIPERWISKLRRVTC